jgi:hypothetical protein
MPNFDGGHYFLSALIPIQNGLFANPVDQGNSSSHTHAIREILALLPTGSNLVVANGSQASSETDSGCDGDWFSPFSRDLRTHFCRLVVIDDPTFVGREHQDAILTTIRKINPVIPGPVDHLPWNYLALIIDFDAPDGNPESLRDYLEGLWSVMGDELTLIFKHCQGFDPDRPRESFIKQVMNGQIETTMSFNDYYWLAEPGLWQGGGTLPNRWSEVLRLPLITAAITTAAIVLLVPGAILRCLLLLLLLAMLLVWLYQRIIRIGMQPFPTAPRTDLRSVLKALYLQREFIGFMIANQGRSPVDLQQGFSRFVQLHRPDSIEAPSQKSGCIPS